MRPSHVVEAASAFISAKTERSMPEEKFPPAPLRMTTRTSGSEDAAAKQWMSSPHMGMSSAFCFLGRFSVMEATCESTVTSRVLYAEAFAMRRPSDPRLTCLKVGGAIAAGGSRNGGQETTAITMHAWFHSNDMIPIGITAPVTQWGPTSSGGLGLDDVENDVFELKMSGRTIRAKEIAWMYGRKIATVTRIIQSGLTVSGLDLPDTPYGFELPESFPEALALIGDERPD